MQRINWPRLRDILICVICIGIVIWGTWVLTSQFVNAILVLLLSLAVAFLLTPAVNFLVRYHVPRLLAAIIVYIIILAVVGGVFSALIFSLIQQVQKFSATVNGFFTTLPSQVTSLENWLVAQGIPKENIAQVQTQIQKGVTDFATSLAGNALNIVSGVANAFINILLVLFLSFYFTLDGKRIRDGLISIVPKRSMSHILLFEDALNRVVGNYIRGQLTLALLIGILAGVGCTFLGLRDYALIIGVMAFLFETIPMVGPGLASIPAILISILLQQNATPDHFLFIGLQDPLTRTLWIVGYFVVIQMIESNILGPRIVGHAVGLHPVASILALIIGADFFGAFGALLATPIVAAAWVVVASLYRSAQGITADEMLAKKRTPWVRVLRRPSGFPLRGRKTAPLPTIGGRGKAEGGVEDMSIAESKARKELEPASVAAPPMSRFAHVSSEHLDLLRPIPSTSTPSSERTPGHDTYEIGEEEQ